jgi:ABC-type dipeptide/oligopeptide/nickel transport system permease subunit
MAAPLEMTPETAAPEAILEGVRGEAIEGRSLGQIAWMRLKRDKVALGSGVFIIFLLLVAIFGPYLVQDPTIFHANLIDPTLSVPRGRFGGISLAHPLGVEPVNGRDVLARVVNGARVSMLIAFLATALAVSIGVVMGVVAGFFGGWLDAVIARTMDVFLAFPLLVFAIALVGVIPSSAFGLSGNSLRIGLLIFVIGFFAWPYILFRELLPNLVAPILVYSTLLIPTNILFEAALSYLGVGIIPPTPSWGGMVSDAVNSGLYSIDPMFMIVPGLAIFLTVIAFNLLGDGLRDALDPRSTR